MNRWPHSDYFRDRCSERDLCTDFPGDEILIDGLHAMQLHFINNNVNIDIPVLRVMNTVHYIVAYMFTTSCSGDPIEYEIMAYDSLSRDKQLTLVTMIVLAAMLKRTGGYRAQHCRNLILENRNPDFDEGVALYDRFLRNAEKRFAEEDFLIDTQQLIKQINEQKEIIALQNKQISSLNFTITTMAEQKQQTIVYNYGTYNDIHDNPNATIYACPENKQTEDVTPEEEPAETIESIIFTKKAKQEGKIPSIIKALQKSVQGRKDKTRAFVQELHEWQNDAYVDAHYNARVMYDELVKLMPISFGYEIFKKHYNNTI